MVGKISCTFTSCHISHAYTFVPQYSGVSNVVLRIL